MSNLISNGCRNPHWDESQILLVKGTTWMVISPLVMANLPVWMVKCNVLMVKCKLLMVKSNPYFLKIICFFPFVMVETQLLMVKIHWSQDKIVNSPWFFAQNPIGWDGQVVQISAGTLGCLGEDPKFSKETWSLAMEKMVGVRLSSQTCVFIPGNMSSCSQNRDCGNQANHFNPQSLWWLHAICVWIIPIYL